MFLVPRCAWLKAGLGCLQVILTAWSEIRWYFGIVNTAQLG